MTIEIPRLLSETVGRADDGAAWLSRLPGIVEHVVLRWNVVLESPVTDGGNCSWVAFCRRGAELLVLKIGWPHYEARDEIDGLLFWSGGPTVALREFDRGRNALLLDRCVPGTPLKSQPEPEQDRVISGLLRRLWGARGELGVFRPLASMIEAWSAEARAASREWPDHSLAERGLETYATLSEERTESVLLATDLHAGNVLSDSREPWVVIDPKPYLGDPCYDATQHLLNCRTRLRDDPRGTIDSFASLLGVDPVRVARWAFARLATESGDRSASQSLAIRLRDGFAGQV